MKKSFQRLRAKLPRMLDMQRKVFWLVFITLEIVALVLPLWWQVFAIVPITAISWWVAYRSDWF